MHKQDQCDGGDATAQCDPDTGGRHITCIVSISNLPGAFDSTSLKALFTEVGPVLDCFMVNDEGSYMTGRGFVQFTTAQYAEKAIQQMNGFLLSDKNIVVELANVQPVIFGGLENRAVAREVIRQAREIGAVLSVNYPVSEDIMELYGFTQDGCKSYAASVLFADVKSAKSAVSGLHHMEVEGVTVWARPLAAEEIVKGNGDLFRSTKSKQEPESDKGEQLTIESKEKGWLCSDSAGLIDKRVKTLLSASSTESDPEMDLYGGPQIFNTVTWSLDGPARKVKFGHLNATGHQRLWYFIKGQLLDVSSVLGPDMMVFTTAMSGTFYFNTTFEDHSVTLPIDGREGWNYGVENKHGCFEYYHQANGCPYLGNKRNWSMLTDCLPDYSGRGLCPTDKHEDVEMGIPAARRACKTLSSYKGELPVPPEVRKACATLITYGIEAVKSNEALEWTCSTLEDEEEEFTLSMLHSFASPRIKKWSLLGKSKLHYLVRRLNCEEGIFPKIAAVTGIDTIEGVLDSVCVLPYNTLLDPRVSKARDWASFPLDQNADMAGGRPHFLSASFARPWPTNTKLAVLRSPQTVINPASILPFAKVSSGSGELPYPRAFSPGAGAALRIQKRTFSSPGAGAALRIQKRTFSSGAFAALRVLTSLVK